jgi:NAD(P)-dependent dehydrogenase (short-subunit alcohol dehydrogenase family)
MQGDGKDARVADEVVAEIRNGGGIAVACHESVADRAGGQAIVDAALDLTGRVDAVISNAGIFDTVPFEELSAEQWRRMLKVHLDGSFHVCQPAFRHMKRQGYGRFVMVSSSAALFGLPNEARPPRQASLASRTCWRSRAQGTESFPTPSCPPAIPGW